MAIDSPERSTITEATVEAPARQRRRLALGIGIPTGAVALVAGLLVALSPDAEPVSPGSDTDETTPATAPPPERTGSVLGIGCIVLGEPKSDGLHVRVGITGGEPPEDIDELYNRRVTVDFGTNTVSTELGGVGHGAVGEFVLLNARGVRIILVPQQPNNGMTPIDCVPWPQ